MLLDHGAHRPVKEDNAFLQQARELLSFGGEWFFKGGHTWEKYISTYPDILMR
jgi:hypothetical protein